jgi:hypothetical protein
MFVPIALTALVLADPQSVNGSLSGHRCPGTLAQIDCPRPRPCAPGPALLDLAICKEAQPLPSDQTGLIRIHSGRVLRLR